MVRARFPDDRAAFDMPNIRVAVPSVERLAVEDLGPAVVVVKVDRLRLHKVECLRTMGRLRRCLSASLCRADSTGQGRKKGNGRQESFTKQLNSITKSRHHRT